MFMSTLSVCLLAVFGAVFACSNDTPFSSDVVPRQFTQDMTCFPVRYRNITTVQLNATHLVFIPTRIGYNFGQFCQESYVFELNRGAPKMTHFPYLDNLSDNGHRICGAEQERQKVVAWPQDSTRSSFTDGLKKTIAGLTALHDSHCQERGYGLTQTVYKHPWVQQPISYLQSVAYMHGICLED